MLATSAELALGFNRDKANRFARNLKGSHAKPPLNRAIEERN
jgi:hypothetical protein